MSEFFFESSIAECPTPLFCEEWVGGGVLGQSTIMNRSVDSLPYARAWRVCPHPRGYDTRAADTGLTRARHRGCGPK